MKKRKAMEEEVKKMKKLIGEHEKDVDKYNAEIAVCKKSRQVEKLFTSYKSEMLQKLKYG